MSFSFELGVLDQDRNGARTAGGQPRYSSTVYRRGGSFIRRWTDDLAEAMAAHDDGKADPDLDWVITFDHVAEEDLAYDVAPHGKSRAQLKAECDEALDQMWERWMTAECAAEGGGH